MSTAGTGVEVQKVGVRQGLLARVRALHLSIPLIIVVAALAYLPYVGQMGFYYNDWHLLGGRINGLTPVEVFWIDRPFLGVIYTLTYGIFGDRPIFWHLFAFTVRVAGGLGFYWLLQLLWPNRRTATTSMALLFLVYPGFLQQPMALTFSNHFLAYSAAIFSLVFTLLALRADRGSRRVLLTVLAAGLTLFYLMTYEYMIGLEAVRLALMIYHEWPRLPARWGARLLAVARRWWVYLAPIGLFLVWRVFIFGGSKESTSVSVLATRYLTDPVGMVNRFFVETTKDIVETMVLGWGVPLYQYMAKAEAGKVLAAMGVAALAVLLTLFWFAQRRHEAGEVESAPAPDRRFSDTIRLGALFVLFTIVPVVFSNRQVLFESNFDRYTLHATIGVALLIGGVIFTWLHPAGQRWAVVCLVFLSVTLHVLNGEQFRTFWDVQKSLWHQMTWRMPQLADKSFQMILLPDRVRFEGDTEIWVPTNYVYNGGDVGMRSYAEVLNRDTIVRLMAEEPNYPNWRGLGMIHNYDRALVTSMPALTSCAHVLDGRQMELSELEDPVVRLAAPHSKAGLIDPNPVPKQLPEEIFGPEPDRGWCYHYQTASLLRQRGDWEALASLGEQVLAQGLKPADGVEWMPFYEGFLNAGQVERAATVLGEIRQNESLRRSLCLSLQASPGVYSSPEIFGQMVSEICAQE